MHHFCLENNVPLPPGSLLSLLLALFYSVCVSPPISQLSDWPSYVTINHSSNKTCYTKKHTGFIPLLFSIFGFLFIAFWLTDILVLGANIENNKLCGRKERRPLHKEDYSCKWIAVALRRKHRSQRFLCCMCSCSWAQPAGWQTSPGSVYKMQHQSGAYYLWSVRFPLHINLFMTLELSFYALFCIILLHPSLTLFFFPLISFIHSPHSTISSTVSVHLHDVP